MSISHQRRQGTGTVDGQILQASNTSDLGKEANEFYGFKKPFSDVLNFINFGSFPFPPAYGRHNVSINLFNGGAGTAVVTWFFYLGEEVVQRLQSQTIAGARDTKYYSFIGRYDRIEVVQALGDTISTALSIEFNGFRLGNDDGFIVPIPVVEVNPNNDGKVHLTTEDLITLGYTYQWNLITGQGEFVNPNIPNAVFLPDGSGNYEFELVVNDGDISSLPVEVEVFVPIYNTRIIVINDTLHDQVATLGTISSNSTREFFISSLSPQQIEFTLRPYAFNDKYKIERSYVDDQNFVDLVIGFTHQNPYYFHLDEVVYYRLSTIIAESSLIIHNNSTNAKDVFLTPYVNASLSIGDELDIHFPRSVTFGSNFTAFKVLDQDDNELLNLDTAPYMSGVVDIDPSVTALYIEDL